MRSSSERVRELTRVKPLRYKRLNAFMAWTRSGRTGMRSTMRVVAAKRRTRLRCLDLAPDPNEWVQVHFLIVNPFVNALVRAAVGVPRCAVGTLPAQVLEAGETAPPRSTTEVLREGHYRTGSSATGAKYGSYRIVHHLRVRMAVGR